jgi:signal peptidase I
MGLREDLRAAARKRRVRREAQARVREARLALRRYESQIPAEARAELAAAARDLDAARIRGDHDATCDGLVRLDELVDRHLPYARKSTFREYAESIAVAVLIALFLRAFVVEAFKIPSGSMIPTMEVGDHIFVNKFIYGIRIPFTKLRFFDLRPPRRGEVIVFIYPREPDKDFIKRIVGIEGDRIEVRRNVLFVNGKAVTRHPVPGTRNTAGSRSSAAASRRSSTA